MAVQARLLHGLVQHAAGRPDEGVTRQIFVVSRLLPDQHHARRARAFTKHRLRGVPVQRAAATPLNRQAHRSHGGSRRQELERADAGAFGLTHEEIVAPDVRAIARQE